MTKQELELLGKIKIRNGFDKFIPMAIHHFNEHIITEDLAVKIIKFINNSNSKLSESYYILRKNMNHDEYIEQLELNRTIFVESCYKHTNRKNVQRKFQSRNYSRGYSGYTTINNKQYYCRSTPEFIYLQYFTKNLHENERLEMEDKIFHIGELSYKPDFFIYTDDILTKVIEVKNSVSGWDPKYGIFKTFFESIDISFEIVHNAELILKQNIEFNIKLNEWKLLNSKLNVSMAGSNNPNYGNHMTETQKNLAQRNRILSFLKRIQYYPSPEITNFEELVEHLRILKKNGQLGVSAPSSVISFSKYFKTFTELKDCL